MTAPHAPVLLNEVIEALAPQPGDVIIDATFGASGVRIYGAGGGERTTAPLSIGLPPVTQNGVVCY